MQSTGIAKALLIVAALAANSPADPPPGGATLVTGAPPTLPALGAPPPSRNGQEAASVPDGRSSADAARAAIEQANAAWLDAFRRGDRAGLASIYAPDASLYPPGDARVEGPENIAAYFEAHRQAGLAELGLRTVEVVPVGDIAYEVGLYGAAGLAPGEDRGRYFAIWKLQEDGAWRHQVGIWSSTRDEVRRAAMR